MILKSKFFKKRRIKVKINEDKTEFKFNYFRFDGNYLYYEVHYDSMSKMVIKLIKCLNGKENSVFEKNKCENYLHYDEIISKELSNILDDIENNVEKKY